MPIKIKRKPKRCEWKPGGHPWKIFHEGLFKSKTEAYNHYQREGRIARDIKKVHKDSRGQRVKSA